MLEPVKRYGKIFISLKVNHRTFSWLKSNRLSQLTSWGAYKEEIETPVPKTYYMPWVRLDFGNTYSAKSTELTGEKNARKFKEFSASNLTNCMEMKNAYNISLFYCLTDRGCYNISLKLPFIAYGKDGRQSLHFMIRKDFPRKRKIRLLSNFWLPFPRCCGFPTNKRSH